MTQSLTRRLVGIAGRPPDARDRRRAALHVLDWLGCALAGARQPAGEILRQMAPMLGAGRCRAILTRDRLAPAGAAFINGGLGNILEMDDVHRTSILHPGPVVIPAALAAAEAHGVPPSAFLDAVVRGYEAVIRVGRSVGPSHYAHWHNTASCGPFGAAMAVASVLGIDDDQRVAALGNAGSTASGLWRCRHEPVMTKQWHTAIAAQAGLMAATLAANGFSGPAFILEGEQGFFSATAPDATPDRVTARPDEDWLIFDTSFKPWPACRHAHATIDCALALRDRVPEPGQVTEIVVETYRDAVLFCDRVDPTTPQEAKFSLQHCAAATLIDGPPALDLFEPRSIARPDIAALRRKARVSATSPFVESYPEHYGAAVAVTLSDGRTHRAEGRDALGDPANPIGEDGVVGKAQILMEAAGIKPAGREMIIDAALGLTTAATLDPFLSALDSEDER